MIVKFDDFADVKQWAAAKQKRFTFIIDKGCAPCRRSFVDVREEVTKHFPEWEFCQIYISDWLETQKFENILHPDNQTQGFYRLGISAVRPDQVEYVINYIRNCK